MKELREMMEEIKETLGINAFEKLEHYLFTLYRKLEDLTNSRENWKRKFLRIKGEKNDSQHK